MKLISKTAHTSAFLFGISLVFTFKGLTQDIRQLKIGDSIPEIEVQNVINYPTPTIKLSNFKGKLVLLNFWATWCSPCISKFPILDSLQRKFKNELQIINITHEDNGKVVSFLDGLEKVKNIHVMTVVGDSVLRSMFYHQTLPHYVWIDRNGKVFAITGGDEITETNLRNAIELKENESLKQKIDNTVVLERKNGILFTPVLHFHGNGNIYTKEVHLKDVIINSTLTKYQEGGVSVSINKPTVISLTNTSIYGLYRAALWKFRLEMFNENKTIVEVSDSVLSTRIKRSKENKEKILLQGENEEKLKKDYRFCYELKLSSALSENRFEIMLDELNKYFGNLYGIEGVIEKRKTNCLVLKKISEDDKIAAKSYTESQKQNSFIFELKGSYIADLVAGLTQSLRNYPPIVDETKYTGKIDISLICNLSDLRSVNTKLKEYGLKLEEEQRNIDIAVIRDKRPNIVKKNTSSDD
jgi:Thiol-disulfide isomerase and thioredoxins